MPRSERGRIAETSHLSPKGLRNASPASGCADQVVLPTLAGLVQGEDEDDALARGLGVASAGALSDVQRKYAERVKAKLAEVRLLPFCCPLHAYLTLQRR